MDSTSLMSSLPFNNAEIGSCDDIDNDSIKELTVNGNNYDQFQEIDPDINYYNNLFTCKYQDVSQFAKLKKKSNVITFIHTNIRSMSKKLNEFQLYLKMLNYNLSFIAVSETQLKSCDADTFPIQNYKHDYALRTNFNTLDFNQFSLLLNLFVLSTH